MGCHHWGTQDLMYFYNFCGSIIISKRIGSTREAEPIGDTCVRGRHRVSEYAHERFITRDWPTQLWGQPHMSGVCRAGGQEGEIAVSWQELFGVSKTRESLNLSSNIPSDQARPTQPHLSFVLLSNLIFAR